ncbi:MAG TPA: PLP-dependent transferase [Vicinamibacterales bacterium]|nr:PLP-dependent transferase [Vicinamibacterales bacterium]
MHLETLAVHAGHSPDPVTGAVTPPISLSTTFERLPDGTYRGGFVYARADNPNRRALEECLAALEGGAGAVAFSSGQAATAAVLQTLRPGDHVIAPQDCYFGTAELLTGQFGAWGLQSTLVDMTDTAAVRAALRPETRLVWIETPSNPLIRTTDIRAIVEIAHAASAIVACDNTWATPVLQRPLELGADLVMHATTKYLGGHSDTLGGVVVTREPGELLDRVRRVQTSAGAVPSPFESWLVLRGIRTLPYRMRAHCDNAMALARFLETVPGVERVHYPGLERDPGYEIAARQMQRPGGMLSFCIRGGREEAMAVTARLRIITRATSLGGPETLIEHRASVEGPHTRAPENLLRVSVGLEHPDDLIQDLRQALEVIP